MSFRHNEMGVKENIVSIQQESPKEGAFPKWCLQCFMNALVCWEVQVGLGGDGWSHKEYKVNLDYSLRENSIWMRTGMCSVGNGSLSYFILRSLVIQQRQSGVMNEWKQGAAWHRDLGGGVVLELGTEVRTHSFTKHWCLPASWRPDKTENPSGFINLLDSAGWVGCA